MTEKNRRVRQEFAVLIGGFVLAIVLLLSFLLLQRQHGTWLALLALMPILWREYEFTGMRVELKKLRNAADKAS